MDPGFQESLLSAFWFVNYALPVKFECVRSKISQFCLYVVPCPSFTLPAFLARPLPLCSPVCFYAVCALHASTVSLHAPRDRWLCVLPRGRMNVNVNVQDRYIPALLERETAGSGSLGAASSESAAGSVRLRAPGLRLLSHTDTVIAGVLVGVDGFEVRLCDPCARVRPCVPCVSPRCLFTRKVTVL